MNQMACPKTGFSRRGFMIGIAGLTFPVAALHDTSIQMIERHYARWIDSNAESEPLMAAEEAIERRSALTR